MIAKRILGLPPNDTRFQARLTIINPRFQVRLFMSLCVCMRDLVACLLIKVEISSPQEKAGSAQEGAGLELPKNKTQAEITAEERLYARRKRRHVEALGSRETHVETLFPREVAPSAQDWNDDDSAARKPAKGAQKYVKLVQPNGKLTREMATDLVKRLDLPVQKEFLLLVDLFYRHYYTSSSAAAPKIPKGLSVRKVIALHFKKRKFGQALVTEVYSKFKKIMNSPDTYDAPQISMRGRVQNAGTKADADYILPIPKTKSGQLDKRYTRGTYNSARDMLDRRKYMSIAGGPEGQYQVDLLDMTRRSKPYNHQFWYLLTALNTNSRYVYAVPIKKGKDEKAGETAASRRADGELSDDKKVKPQWIQKQIIPAMKRIRAMIEDDIAQDEKGDRRGLTHRRMTSVMTDAGAEFQLTFKEWLAEEGISSITCEPETHEEMSRLNSFHRYFRQRYQAQWRKYHENPREYGGPVRWVAIKASKVDGFYGLSDEAVDADQKDVTFAEYEPEEQKLALAAGVWRVTYWEDWIH